jgi:alcohol dehydrogenase (NADP+)
MENISKFESFKKVFGTFQIKGEVKEVVKQAIRIGYRHIDTAALYGTEEGVGEGIREMIEKNEIRREEVMVTSKVWCSQFRFIREACEASLKRLGLDFIDVFLLHWPIPLKPDKKQPPVVDNQRVERDSFPLHLAWKQMEELVDLGMVKFIGVSNWNVALLNDLLGYARVRPSVNQFEFHPYYQQNELVEFCIRNDIMPFAFRTIFRPADSRFCEISECVLDHCDVLQIAEKYGKTPAQVLICWTLSKGLGVIVKSESQARIEQNFDTSIVLEACDIQLLDQIPRLGMYTDSFSFFGIHIFK